MKVKIKRIDKSLPLPEYHTPGAVAFDLSARKTTTIEPGTVGRIPTNIIIEIPEGYMIILKDRSSTAKKTGLISIVGFIDQDFHGTTDEMLVQFFNPQPEPITIQKGERLAQAAFVRVDKPEFTEVDEISEVDRGAFGSTG